MSYEITTTNSNISMIADSNLPNDEVTVETEAGAIVGTIFGLLIFTVMVALAVIMIRRKRFTDKDYKKQLRIQRSTKESAGVYMDTTMTDDLMVPPHLQNSVQYESDGEL